MRICIQLASLVLLVSLTLSFAIEGLPGVFDLRDDCVKAYECCRFEFGSIDFDKCCNDHGCCPLCEKLTKGCSYNSEHFDFGVEVEYHPTMCVKLQCLVNLSPTPPYMSDVVMPMYYNPGNIDFCEEVSSTTCVDAFGIYREEGERWLLSAKCEECMCSSGKITCSPIVDMCPSQPHPSCLAMNYGCCPLWNCDGSLSGCVTDEGKLVPYGETWWDSSDRCVYKKCTESGVIKYTKVNCSANCPDPDSFGVVCVQYFDQCKYDVDCKPGDHCCLVAGCGKECMRPCVDESGVVRKIGSMWYSSGMKLECLRSGISVVDDNTIDITKGPPITVKPTSLPVTQNPTSNPPTTKNPTNRPTTQKPGQNPTPFSTFDCLLKSGLNLTALADQIETLGRINETIPVRDPKFLVDAFASLEINGTGPQNMTLSPQDLMEVQVQARAFEWQAVLPLIDEDTTQQQVSALNAGELNVRVSNTVDRLIAEKNIVVDDSPSLFHQVAFRRTDPIATQMAELGLAIGEATSRFMSSFDLPMSSAGALSLLGDASDCSTRFRTNLRPVLAPPCDPTSKYRTLDGTCNNLNHNLWGAAFTKFRRILHPDYGDGVFTLRRAADGGPLPSARRVSEKVNKKESEESSKLSFLHVTYGQFLDHDLTATPIGKGYLGSPIKCCDDLREKFRLAELSLNVTKEAIREAQVLEPSISTFTVTGELELTGKILNNLMDQGDKLIGTTFDAFRSVVGSLPQGQVDTSLPLQSLIIHPRPVSGECAPISIPLDDEFYSPFGETCMEFVRSVPAPMCFFGPREQLNQHTAYLDGSVIYGVKKETTDALRTFENGLLTTQATLEGKVLLPAEEEREDGCNVDDKYNSGIFCFKAGDGRVNEQILLTMFHTVWAREHNRVATVLKALNPSWNDEKLFQEARRIVVAELQHVTYKEYLPIVLGNVLMTILDMNPLTGNQYTTHYDDHLDASIANAFATAAYRFGHSQVNDFIHKVNVHGVINSESLSDMFFNPFSLYEEEDMEDLARGATSFPARKLDGFFSDEISGKLFRGNSHFGLDLVALNIQRGRDHGLPGYKQWKNLCSLPAVNSFEDLSSVLDEDIINAFQEVYDVVDDIDLFIGGVSERPFLDGLLGPTFACIVADQFFRIKKGDRFWYEYKDGPGAFTEAQLEELHKVSLARILCNNIPELTTIQPSPLELPSATNPRVSCYYSSLIENYSLSPWQM